MSLSFGDLFEELCEKKEKNEEAVNRNQTAPAPAPATIGEFPIRIFPAIDCKC